MSEDRRRRFETWDVFTGRRFGGNPLAVVFDADGLTSDEMQAVAREFNLSETVFILSPESGRAAARLRIFVPTHEIPFAGHPVIGATAALCADGAAAQPGAPLTLELAAGLFEAAAEPVVAPGLDAGCMRASFLNPNAPRAFWSDVDGAAVARALGLPADALHDGARGLRTAGAGLDFLYAETDAAALAAARPPDGAFGRLLPPGCEGVYLFCAGSGDGVDYEARMFAPQIGVPEDPATGSAACALPAAVMLAGTLSGARRWTVRQGRRMGRESLIRVSFSPGADGPGPVRIAGDAVPVQAGFIRI